MSAAKCAICGKPQSKDYRPFCSKRCADVDLQRWFSGRYAIPAVEEDEPDEDSVLPTQRDEEDPN
jgi:endogenous inhibitor of DNA gyrase (YacG/DUF329 family)